MALEKLPGFPGDEKALQVIESGLNHFVDIYEWQSTNVILGRTTKLDPDINVEACREAGVPILRRMGGGGAVVLLPGVWVITACYARDNKDINIPLLLERIVLEIGASIEQVSNIKISLKGMGDLCLGNKKILGSSLYLGRGAIMYQGSLLVSANLPLISTFLNHPSKEPEYRQGREHGAFITNLNSAFTVDVDKLKQCLEQKLQAFVI